MNRKSSTEAKKRYNKKHYDRLTLIVKKGKRNLIKTAATRKKMSVNKYIKTAVLKQMEQDEREQETTEEKKPQ